MPIINTMCCYGFARWLEGALIPFIKRCTACCVVQDLTDLSYMYCITARFSFATRLPFQRFVFCHTSQ